MIESLITTKSEDQVQLRRNLHSNYNLSNPTNKSRSVSLVDRMSKLQYSQNSWQSKVPEKDVRKFTVEGKMQQMPAKNQSDEIKMPKNRSISNDFEQNAMNNSDDVNDNSIHTKLSPNNIMSKEANEIEKSPIDSPARGSSARNSFRSKKTPKPINFKTSPPLQRHSSNRNSFSSKNLEDDESHDDHQKDDIEAKEETKIENTVEIELPKQDDKGFSNFFTSMKENQCEKIDDCDFDLLLPAIAGNRHNSKLEHHKKDFAKARKAQRRKPPTKNPLKSLAERSDIRQTYTENLISEVSESKTLEIDTTKKHALAGIKQRNVHSHLANEALDALQKFEDFSNVQLRRGNTNVPNAEYVPYKRNGVMLLQVKGRRPCQVRLVKASHKSVNSGDAYILISNDRPSKCEIYVWLGKFVNAIERSRASEVAQAIVQQKDLGCKATKVQTIEEEKSTVNAGPNKRFWQLLGCENNLKVNAAGPPEEDDDYSLEINDLNLIWKVDHDKCELSPVESGWGCVPKYEILSENENQVLIFDFGSEMYTWCGKNASVDKRNMGLKLAKGLWDSSENNIKLIVENNHPLFQDDLLHDFGPRPDWALLGKIPQNGETILFREKFSDWPQDKNRKKKASELRQKFDSSVPKTLIGDTTKNEGDIKFSTDITCDPVEIADQICTQSITDPNMQLEGTFIGRGRSYYDSEERRQYEIDTLDLKVWHVSSDADKEGITPLQQKEVGQFYSEDTYVVRWKYKVSLTGRTLKGGQSKHVAVGRERWAYFFWQGSSSRINEKGAAALMTVELDTEKGPQIRVDQGKEDAAFLNLFDSHMMIHDGSRTLRRHSLESSLYVMRGESSEEACMVQVPKKFSSLRSRGAFILIDSKNKKMYVWIGQNCPIHKIEMAKQVSESSHYSKVDHFKIENEKQYEESISWKNAMKCEENIESTPLYLCAKNQLENKTECSSVRMFRMTSLSGEFVVNEVLCPFLKADVPNCLPFNQEDLYSVQQPGKFVCNNYVDGI